MKKAYFIIGIICISMINVVAYAQQGQSEANVTSQVSDSLLESYSIEELLQYKNYYLKEISGLEAEKDTLRKVGIEDAEKFLEQHSNSRIVDKILMRLAELYFQKADEDYLEQLNQYDRLLDQLDSNQTTDLPPEPERDYSKSLSLYQRIMDEFPQSALFDDALYNKGYVLEQSEQKDSARVIYQTVIDEFPDSRYVPDAMMRIAEYYV